MAFLEMHTLLSKAARLKGSMRVEAGTAEWLSYTGAPNTPSVWVNDALNDALWAVS